MTVVSLIASVVLAGCRATAATATASPTALPVTAPPTVTLPAETASPQPTTSATPFPPTFTPSSTPSATPTGFAPHTIGTVLPPSSQVIGLDNVEHLVEFGRWGQGRVGTVLHSPDGQLLAVSGSLGVWFYDAATLVLVRHVDLGAPIGNIAFSPDGRFLAIPLNRAGVWFVDTPTWQANRLIAAAADVAAFSPDGSLMATNWNNGNLDPQVRLWRVSDGNLVQTLEGARDGIASLAFAPTGDTLAAAAANLAAWTLSDGALLQSWSNLVSGGRYYALSYSPDGKEIAAAADGGLAIFQVSSGRLLDRQVVKDGSLYDVAYSPDGTHVAGVGNGVYVWEVVGVFVGGGWRAGSELYSDLSWSADGQSLVVTSWNEAVERWSVSERRAVPILTGFTSEVSALAWLPGGDELVVGYDNGDVQLVRATDGWALQSLDAGYRNVESVSVAPDGEQLVASYRWGEAILWDVTNGRQLHQISRLGY